VRFAGRAKVDADVSVATLDLAPYLEAMRAAVLADGPWLIAPTNLPIANAIQSDLKITADQILAGKLRLGHATIAARTSNGEATVDIAKAQFYGGNLEGKINAAMVGDTLSVSATAKATAVPARVALGVPLLDGTGAVDLDVHSLGSNWGEFVQASAGTVSFAVSNGSLAGVDMNVLAEMADDPLAEPAFSPDSTTKFNRMTGTMSVAGGVLQTDNLLARGPDYSLAVRGWGSLLSGVIDAKATLTKSRTPGQTYEVPLTIGGTWSSPQFALDRAGPETLGSPPG
jgi:AsmA protein